MRITLSQWSIVSRRGFSTSPKGSQKKVIELAYTRHEPADTPAESRPPIIVMHGLFGSQRNNRTFTKELSRPVYTVDLRNHGASPHSPRHDYTSMSEDLEHFISNEAPIADSKPILIGHSMGAKVAMTCALRSPRAYSGIVPLDNAPVDAALKSDFGNYVRAMLEIEAANPPLTKQSDADKILEKYESNVAIRQFLLTNLTKDPTDKKMLKWRIPLNTLAKSLDYMADFPFKDPDSARFEGPTLVVRGGASRYVADETLPVFGRFFPRFELVDIPGAGHWVVSEAFEETTKAVVEWTKRVVDQDG
ncbi:hypothetical protein LTR05_001051 [Lithohypha guttulata]|uniref:AB hydrolase-1 domain-containing protein n=1 Tax=Lithohypha guttulata TaxID=1690604 RepID=A0AAN7T708_9EURO|nr:hypothetical protein LTR05_001051 [Lithohypha guttulata]